MNKVYVYEVIDADIRYRPLVILAEDNATPDTMKKRVTWEHNVRYGRATRLTVSVQGWKADGVLWQPNKRVKIESPTLGVDAELLITNTQCWAFNFHPLLCLPWLSHIGFMTTRRKIAQLLIETICATLDSLPVARHWRC